MQQFLGNPAKVGTRRYPNMLKDALDSGRVTEIRALGAGDGHVPGFDATQPLRMEVLAPVPETVNGQPAFRWFGNDGKTKNGHSIVLRLVYQNVSVLLGGDLNVPAEEYLLEHYTTMDPDDEATEDALITSARQTFESDVAKACHHGSADFTDLFLRSVNALATVVSSGDNEPHSHPRPDTLGALGKCGRGNRPLIFRTGAGALGQREHQESVGSTGADQRAGRSQGGGHH